jgi:hypothetical protein
MTNPRSKRHSQMAIKFKLNAPKAVEVIVWFANKRPGVDFHTILKLLFFADIYHLNQWGRPIVGDTYNALPYGPVAQTTYDLLRREPLALELLRADDDWLEARRIDAAFESAEFVLEEDLEPPLVNWATKSEAPLRKQAIKMGQTLALQSMTFDYEWPTLPFSVARGFRVWPRREPDLKKLSQSDVEALDQTWQRLSQLNFAALTKKSHDHPAYKNAERAGRQIMAYEDFLEGNNAQPEMIEELREAAPRIVI